MTGFRHQGVPGGLPAHLTEWLGTWPATTPLQLIGTPRRLEPGWDGEVHPALAVADPITGALLPCLPSLLGLPGRGANQAVFRWTSAAPTPLPDAGQSIPADGDGVPAWLQPFGGQMLVVTGPDGRHLAGVGIKHHDRHGHELSVVTSPAVRGRGLARALVAQAARRVLDEGAVPTYLHDAGNAASARVAEAAGFPDHGWTSFGISEAPRTGQSSSDRTDHAIGAA